VKYIYIVTDTDLLGILYLLQHYFDHFLLQADVTDYNLSTAGMTSPKFQQFLKSVVAGVGKEAVFECSIQGEPAPVITWSVSR